MSAATSFFAFQRIDHGIGPADNGYFIRVMTEARPWVVQRIEHDEVEILPFQFFVRMRRLVMGFEGKAMSFCPSRFIWPSVWAMSRVGFRRRTRSSVSRLILRSEACAGVKSATAAHKMAASDSGKCAVASRNMSSADSTSIRRMPPAWCRGTSDRKPT